VIAGFTGRSRNSLPAFTPRGQCTSGKALTFTRCANRETAVRLLGICLTRFPQALNMFVVVAEHVESLGENSG